MRAPYALLLMRNPGVARKTAQILGCGGLETKTMEEAGALSSLPDQGLPSFVYLALSDLRDALTACEGQKGVNLFLRTEQVDPDLFAKMKDAPQIRGVFGLRYPGAPPRHWELISVARRLSAGYLPPPQAPLSWGHTWHEQKLATTNEREAMVEAVRKFCMHLSTSRQAASIAQLADELIMNAMYDAPVDANNRPRYAHNRQQAIELEPQERPTFGFGSDGSKIVVSASDPFGRLTREAVFGGMHRGLTTGTMDTSGGGAGLGMTVIYQAAKVVFFDVAPGVKTQVTAVIELDIPPRQMRKLPGSVHFFRH